MPRPAIACTSILATTWEPYPLPPESIREGRPEARVHWLRVSPAGEPAYFAGLWTCQPCVFDYTFELDEFAHVLEGRVTVSQQGGPTLELKAGDVATFPRGSVTRWEVRAPLKKAFVDTAG